MERIGGTCTRVGQGKRVMATVAERDRVITGSLQHDVREDVSVIACGVVSRDVVGSFDT